jgi:hypothetical protein
MAARLDGGGLGALREKFRRVSFSIAKIQGRRSRRFRSSLQLAKAKLATVGGIGLAYCAKVELAESQQVDAAKVGGTDELGQAPHTSAAREIEYKVIQDQRLATIRSYNIWYAFGHLVAHAYFWLMLFLSLDLASKPLLIAAAITASLIVWFAYRVVLTIDRAVVSLYPRIIFLELSLGYDFYRDYLSSRPAGDTERSFVEKSEQLLAESTTELWDQIHSLFKDKDFPADRRITSHFRSAAYFSVALFWIVVIAILAPIYFPLP